jgi:catalase
LITLIYILTIHSRIHIQGAFGYFEVTQDITRYTKAAVFKSVGKRARIAVRFFLAGGERGGADTIR